MNVQTAIFRSPLARLGLAGVAALGLATAAQAQQTTPPGANDYSPATSALFAVNGTQLQSTGMQSVKADSFSANYTAAVFSDTNNPLGSGDLTFVYQFTDVSGDAIERLTAGEFAGYLVDAGYTSTVPQGSSFTSGTVAPNAITRSGDGNVIGFGFTGSGNVTNGQTSNILVIKTNATQYTNTTSSLQDHTTVNIRGFKPISAAPEPSTWLLMMAGVGGLGMALRSQRRQKSTLRLA